MSEREFVPEKLVRDGKVAVLISGGFGAGWSTWASSDNAEFLLFHKGLVEMAEREATVEEVADYLEKGGMDYTYMGGWEDVYVVWLPAGTRFTVEEYDGSEHLRTIEDLEYTA